MEIDRTRELSSLLEPNSKDDLSKVQESGDSHVESGRDYGKKNQG